MSASRDKNQKFTFLYSNLYQIYKNEKSEVFDKEVPSTPLGMHSNNRVLKAEDLNSNPSFPIKVTNFRPLELSRTVLSRVSDPVQNLKKNIQELSELHSRLKFMLKELEDLIKE